MAKIIFSVFTLLLAASGLHAQKYFTRDGKISFFSKAPMENIEAHNNSATSILDIETGQIEFAVLIKAFQFEKALMQEHFNENYMESGKFPKAVFKGQVANISTIKFQKDGTYPATVKGEMTIHGQTKTIEVPGTFSVNNGVVSANSKFTLTVADYKIEVPAVVKDNIAKSVEVTFSATYQLFNNK